MTTASESFSADDFRHAFRNHPAGVGVITAEGANGPVAMTASSVFSVSIDPPTLVFSASALSSSTSTIREAETLVVHLTSADDVEIAKLGATSGVDRFGPDVEWDRLPTGEPYYPGASSWLRGKVINVVEASGSFLIVVEAIGSKPQSENDNADAKPLVYHNRTWHQLSENSKLA